MTPADASALLYQAMQLRPGDALPGTQINANVSTIYQREDWNAGSVYVAERRVVSGRSMGEIAAAIGEPVYLQDTIGERDLLNAQAILRGRMLDQAYVDYLVYGRMQGSPVNDKTVAEAVKLVRDALSMRKQKVAA